MRFDVFTLFPEVFPPYLGVGVLEKAVERGLVEVCLHDIREHTHDKHRMTDDTPYGGGGGMVMKPEPLFEVVETILGSPPEAPVVLLTPQGDLFTQGIAAELAGHDRIGLICGRYEGVDERVREHLVTREISIGDFVLTGGELPALLVMDAVSRLLPGVLGDPDGAARDSHAAGLLEHPHYTRPFSFRGWDVPEILRSGDHARIERWRREQSLLRTIQRRPDLIEKLDLSEADRQFLAQVEKKELGDE